MALNGLGIALLFAVALDLVPLTLSPYWLRLPLALFLAGMMLSMLGLFWSGILQAGLNRREVTGSTRRGHWVSALFVMISYVLALMAFAAACWAFLGVTALSHYYDGIHQGMGQGSMPYFSRP